MDGPVLKAPKSELRDPTPVSRARKKPVQRRSRDTVAAIVAAAEQIVASRGEEAMTTTTVAERAGYSIGSVYQYFPDRDAILVALIDDERRMLADRMRRLLARPAPWGLDQALRDQIRFLIEFFARSRRSKRRRLLIVALQDAGTMSLLRNDFAEAIALFWDRLDPSRARINRVNAFVTSQAIWGALHTAAVHDAALLKDPSFEAALLAIVAALRPQALPESA